MKKLFTLIALLLSAVGTVMADHWTPPTTYSQQDRLVVHASLTTNIGTIDDFEIGAFINGELRGATASYTTMNNSTNVFEIEVYGSADDIGKTVTFKAFYKTNGFGKEYPLSGTVSFDHGTVPDPSVGGTVELTLKAVTSYTINSFDVNIGEEVNLADYLTISPSDGVLPDGYTWALGIRQVQLDVSLVTTNNYAKINNGKITGLSIGTDLPIQLVVKDASAGLLLLSDHYTTLATGTFNVVQHATAINMASATWNVEIFNQDQLMNYIANAYTLTPSGATDNVEWEIEDAKIITQNPNGYYPVQSGTTRMRPYIMIGNNKLVPLNANQEEVWITVNVIIPLKSVSFNWPTTNPATSFKCYVGDDIYQRLANLVEFSPSNATDKSFEFHDPDANAWTYLSYNKDKKTLLAQNAGTTFLSVVASGIESSPIKIEIFNKPSTTIAATVDPLIISNSLSVAEANVLIANNLTWGPSGTSPNGSITSTGVFTGSGAITVNGATFDMQAQTLPTGQATVTATLTWNNYDNYDGTDATITQQTATASFVVKISQALAGFGITITPNTSDPTTGTITLEPQPSGADYNMDNFTTAVSSDLFSNWNIVTLSPVANNSLQFTYSSVLPGTFTFTITEGPNGITSQKSFEVPAKVEMASGWQWKSNPYGSVAGNGLQAFFNQNSFIEARTQADLYYNDKNWGFYGSMDQTGISQSQMYKVRMKSAANSYISGGHPQEMNLSIDLVPGWNWVGSPYLYDRSINKITNSNQISGIVLVSKDGGSAESTGNGWTGDLKILKKGEGILIYNPSSLSESIIFSTEVGMNQGNETSAGARNRASRIKVWEYDHTQFASNMTMVVEMPDLQDVENYTIGAFVDGECRGEGVFEDGLGFVTVHCNSGELVNFQLHNELTGEYYDIDQTVKSQMRIGSLNTPFKMTSMQTSTGIGTVNSNAVSSQLFDLNGRQLNSQRKGVNIQRKADGTVRKVVVR